MIKPTVGRVIWLWNAPGTKHDDMQPFAATITYVWSDLVVNVSYFDHVGLQHTLSSMPLHQDDTGTPDKHTRGDYPFAAWMPYQIGQAKAKLGKK